MRFRNLVKGIVVIVGASALGYLLGHLDTGRVVKPSREDAVAGAMSELEAIDPMTHAVLADHMEETRLIFQEAFATGDFGRGRKSLTALIAKFGLPALARANDETAIRTLDRARALIEVFARQYPEGCKAFLGGNLAPSSLKDPEILRPFVEYSDARRIAYEDGKARNAGIFGPDGAIAEARIGSSEFSNAERTLLSDSDNAKDEQLCPLLARLYDASKMPPGQRGGYARAMLSLRLFR